MSERDPHLAGISAILLFGSRARGDNERGSDTDLLLVSPPGEPRHRSIGHLSMFFYPLLKLLADAGDGDLFVCHIAREAKPIFDPANHLEQLRASFKVRESYGREISLASDLGWFIERHADELTTAIIAKRIVWCVRTILIARTAERGAPAFAPAALAATTSSSAGAELLFTSHQRRADVLMRRRFRQFLVDEGYGPPLPSEAAPRDYNEHFKRTKNSVALQKVLQGSHVAEQHYG
ncbi:nucleotidyltransferase domain-containing protein [Mesorhizobium sp. M1163]|uniref:nucleotidyltransferase domain-containing protein n=1 Tax=Mesorhizobium sp. M1163 TaxID=2957065 RepID=UPI00333AD196